MASHLAALPASAEDLADADPFGDIPVVVVVARGLRDDVRRQHDELARRSSRGRVIEAAVGGHWVHLDEPGLVVSAIREVVDAARRRWPHPTHDTENAECAEKSTAAHAERAEGLTAEHAENADEIDRRARGGSS